MNVRLLVFPVVLVASVACDVPSPPKPHGASIPDAGAPLDGSTFACGRGVVVVEQPDDRASTNVGLVATDGTVLSGSVASSATDSVGLTAPLSGDIVVPTMPVTGNEIVLLDRSQAASRIVFVDPSSTGKRELPVGTGFYANPHDYVALSNEKAYVTRYNTNALPGKQPFDAGGDVLVVDPSRLEITASIDLTLALGADSAKFLPRPDLVVVSEERAFVLLGVLSSDFSERATSRIAVIDTRTDEVGDVLLLDGFTNCAGLAISPSGKTLAVSCSGIIDPEGPTTLEGSGIVVVDVSAAPQIVRSFGGASLAPGPVGFHSAFASANVLLFQTFGYRPGSGPGAPDNLVRLDLRTQRAETVLTGDPFTIGGIACDGACGTCFVADAGRSGGVVHRFTVAEDGTLTEEAPIKVETDPGAPPRYVGRF